MSKTAKRVIHVLFWASAFGLIAFTVFFGFDDEWSTLKWIVWGTLICATLILMWLNRPEEKDDIQKEWKVG